MTLLAYGFSPFTMVVVLIIVVLILGNRLPSMMRSLGAGVTEFKKGLAGQGEGWKSGGRGDGETSAEVGGLAKASRTESQ